jgi:hypothetical protein
MLGKTLLAFSIVCNCATLFGLWIAYEAAPATLQARIGHTLLLCGAVASIILYALFAIFVMKPKVEKAEVELGKPRLNVLARKHGIYIGSAGIAARVIGDTLTVRLNIFTCTNIELRHIRATLSTGLAGLEIALDPSAEPHRLLPWLEFEQVFEKTLTAEQMKKVGDWTDTVVINGKAKFEDHIEKEFSVRSALLRPALGLSQPSEPRTLRDRAIALYDRLAAFEQEYERKSDIQQESGESSSAFLTRQLQTAIQQSVQMSADFRSQFENDMRTLNDRIELRSGRPFVAAIIDQAARACHPNNIKEMREQLWECARTM